MNHTAPECDSTRVLRVVTEGDQSTALESESGRKFPLRHAGLTLHIGLRPSTWGRSLLDREFPDKAWVTLSVTEFGVGHRGDEGWSSVLGNDTVFVIDGESLSQHQLKEVRVVSDSDFDGLLRSIGPTADLAGAWEAPPGLSGKPKQEGRGLLSHLPGDYSHDELYMTVGLPQAVFDILLAECRDQLVERVYIHGITGALSTASSFETARDMILRREGQAWVSVDTIEIGGDATTNRDSSLA